MFTPLLNFTKYYLILLEENQITFLFLKILTKVELPLSYGISFLNINPLF